MNWQIIVGILLIIGGFSSITENFGVFLTGILFGAGLLFWGLKKKGLLSSRPTTGTPVTINEVRTLTEETFHGAGVWHYESNIKKLACANPDWKLKESQVISSGKIGKKIFKHNYINKPVKLEFEPDNKHDPNAIVILIAGEKVGYIAQTDNDHVRNILNNREIKSLSAFIGGGEYKVFTEDGDEIRSSFGFSVNIRIKYI